MDLRPGAKLGPYEIVSLLGKGGMGEVWKARDPQIGRDVAIKVSAQQFTDRFEREVRAIGALNHPNICTLYHVGPNYLALELVEGPTLAERIKEGPIPLDEALGYAKQIAEALEAAHEKGITHRDLKPANIKIRPDGSVKVLDFGLATAAGEEQEFGADSPTMLTVGGLILGTAGYMSPEQARGKKADNRADIWVFGVVLFEMVTGKRLFAGQTVSDSLAATLAKEPDLSSAPDKIRPLLRGCMQKDPRQRLQAIGDWKLLLAEDPPASSAAQTAPRRSMTAWITAAVFAVVALGQGVVAWRHYSEQPQVLRVTLQTPEKEQFGGAADIPMISPDGRRVAFAANADGTRGLWMRDLDALTARLLPGTDGAAYPFWSPNSRWVAFFADRKLKKIDVAGGPALTLCDVQQGRSGTWNKDDVIVYGVNPGGLFRVPAAGGTPTPLSVPDAATSELNHRAPWFLPDGRHFLYTARSGEAGKSRIYVDSIDDAKPGSKTRREVLAAASNVVYVPRMRGSQGYLLFVRENTLMAQPFDAGKARTTGDAVPVAEQVDYNAANNAQGQFSASQNGILVYTSGASAGGNAQLTWFDRTGKPSGMVGSPGTIISASLSPDGSTVAADRKDTTGVYDIWLQDLARGTASRFTFGPADNRFPVWSPDGSKIAFFRNNSNGTPWQKAASGVGKEEIMDKDPRPHRVTDWSRDGRYLIEEVNDPKTRADIWVFPTFGDRKPFPYVNTEFQEGRAKLSPNGQFLAYVSDESKRDEVYVQTFPEHGGKWQISTGGGDVPVWSRDGRELYFISTDLKMMAVEVKGDGKKFEAGVPKPLFDVRQSAQFDVSKDGRFLIHVPQDQAGTNVPLTVVVNWQAALKK